MNQDQNDWIERGSYQIYGSDRIFKIHEGNGENLLIIQGVETTSIDWNKVVDSLTKKFKILLPDLLGLGFSDKPKRYKYSLEDSILQILFLIKKNKIESFHIIAQDFGIEITSRLIKKIKEEFTGIKILSISIILDGSLENPKSYFWSVKHPYWVQMEKNSSNHFPEKKNKLRVNQMRDDLDWKLLNQDLIPINLANFNGGSDKSKILLELNDCFVPICVFLTYNNKTDILKEIEDIKNKLLNVRIFSFPELIGKFYVNKNAKHLTEKYLTFYNSI